MATKQFKVDKIPLHLYISNIRDNGFLFVNSENKIGNIFFENGKIITGEIDYNFGINKVEEIKSWKNTHFFFVNFKKEFSITAKFIYQTFCFIDFLSLNRKVSFEYKSQKYELFFSEGCLVETSPNISEEKILRIIKDISIKTVLKVKESNITSGDLKIFFTEQNLNKLDFNFNDTSNNIIKELTKEAIDISKVTENPFKQSVKELEDNYITEDLNFCVISKKTKSEIFKVGFNSINIKKIKDFSMKVLNSYKKDNFLYIKIGNQFLYLISFLNYDIYILVEKENLSLGVFYSLIYPRLKKQNELFINN